MRARRTPPEVLQADDLIAEEAHLVELVGLAVPEVQGRCEFIEGSTPTEQAGALLDRLRSAAVLRA
jgi:hypothetical protein